MNTIKFSIKKNLTTEQHNLELADIYNDNIFGNELNIYHPCNLNLFITNICHNKCNFCINNEYTNTDISDEIYYGTLDLVLEELKNKGVEITITGGEPTLNIKRFVETIKRCNKNNFHCRTVSTTGLKLFDLYEDKPIAVHMIENSFIHNINISRMAIDQTQNDNIFKNKNITNSDIEKMAYFFKLNDAEMRISCNVMQEGVQNMQDILNFVSFYRTLGVETVMFRELVGMNSLELENILSFDENFKYMETLSSIFYDVNVYEYKDMIVKHYITKKDIPKDVIFSLSLRNGIFCDNFSGKKIKIDLKGQL